MSVTAVGPLEVINGPLPQPPEFNIWSVAEPIEGRWRAGVKLWDYPPENVYGFDPCSEGTFRSKYEGSSYANPTFLSFTGYVPIICSTLTRDFAGLEARAEAVMDAQDHEIVERQLLLGDIVANPFIADSTLCPTIVAGAQPAPLALAYLEESIADNTARKGVIHCDPATASAWADNGSLVRVGNQLQTQLGTPLIVSSAYIDQHPDEEAAAGAHQSWAWATGGILAARGEVNLGDEPAALVAAIINNPRGRGTPIEVSSNTFVYRAERDFVVAWDTLGGSAILVDWCDECTVTNGIQ